MSNRSPNADQAAIIKLARQMGYYCHTIAAYFGFNQGRIPDVTKGRIHPEVSAASALPDDFPALAR